MTNTFINHIATIVFKRFISQSKPVEIIVPNKRAKVFLLESLKAQTNETIFAPNILSIEEFIQKVSGITSVNSVELLFQFYEVYLTITPKETQQSFDVFSNWAKTAIQDFNEIDRYLKDPIKVFTYLSEIKALERWKLEPQEKTALIDKHLEFWNNLAKYYTRFYHHLKENKIGYQGLIYREAVAQLENYSHQNTLNHLLFAGFNALNDAEEKIMLHFLAADKATVLWDIDGYFLENENHDAGLFIRRIKKKWKYYQQHSFETVFTNFGTAKNIEIIGTPKSVGQAKIVGNIIENLTNNGEKSSAIAVVLADENLLLPVVNHLPNSVDALNITMGYPAKNNTAQLLVNALLKMHTNAKNRSENKYIFYYKDVLTVLNHPLIEPYSNLDAVVQKIRNENFTFFGYETLKKLRNSENNIDEGLFELLFTPWNSNLEAILNTLNTILTYCKGKLDKSNENESLTLVFIYAVHKTLNQILSFQQKYKTLTTLAELNSLYRQIADLIEVSFEGEPLSGLQIMGVLESRLLDFENVIITSVNEGRLPSGKTQNSFIPYDIKLELNLPTYKEKDAIFSYHFYHLLFRAKNIFLLYNTDSEGIDAGEKSRFLQQLEVEALPQHTIKHSIYNAVLPEQAYEKISISKTAILVEQLHEIATNKGFSPSSLTTYLRNPTQFYFQRVLRINDADEVEENIALNTLGTIIHDALEQLYSPYINTVLTIPIINQLLSKSDIEIEKQFKKVYKEGNIKTGRNYLAFEVAKRNIYNFLQYEKKCIEEGDSIEVLALESNLHCFIENEIVPYKVKIAGKVDRIEKRNGIIRIIDYKTGRVEAAHLKLKDFNVLINDTKYDKIIQLLSYALMYQYKCKTLPSNGIEVGIISFKNLKSGFIPFKYNNEVLVNTQILDIFTTEISVLIQEILNPKLNFIEKTENI
ncbi:PD-(D/E)XK nuclease family protein [Flavobacterium sp.]|uniref:PD-(D/E)XK nuclease family protein n=1 Tax=Flavobacterium sp. TaxID=239 RepID=UPI0035280CA1